MKPILERDLKAKVKKLLADNGVWYFMPVPTGMGRKGIPDFICCVRGSFLAIETKVGDNTLTGHQQREVEAIATAGGAVLVLYETQFETFRAVLERLLAEKIH